jgi:hypothetical protein
MPVKSSQVFFLQILLCLSPILGFPKFRLIAQSDPASEVNSATQDYKSTSMFEGDMDYSDYWC